MDVSGYADLYAFQDEVLATVFEDSLGFYLTGGTALSRYYLGHRYSDDLDLFTHDIGLFSDTFRLVHTKLQKRWPHQEQDVDARDFKRLRIHSGNLELKLDFVADRVKRIGLPVMAESIYVDTVRNILSNKLCAILGRDEARDVADLIFIARKRQFCWSNVIAEAMEKEGFQLEDLLYRLATFPVKSLRAVPMVIQEPLEVYSEVLTQVRKDLDLLGDNTIAESGATGLE
jgi:predicted nucleotidyltransferase component of viral defense system